MTHFFCIDTLSPEPVLRARDGVLRASALAVTSDAAVAVDMMMRVAQAEADRILDDARAEASLLLVRAEQQASAHAIELVKTLQDAQRNFLDRSQEMVIDLAHSMFDRLVMDLTPRKKLEAALRRVQREAPPRLAAPLLRVHPDDLELLPVVEWEVKADAAMSRGMCRLEASNGEWCVDFSAGVTALKASLAQGSGNHPV